jgi:hypothetical protein
MDERMQQLSEICQSRTVPRHSMPARRVLGRLYFYPAEILLGWKTPGGDRASANAGIVAFGVPGAKVLVNIGRSKLVRDLLLVSSGTQGLSL